MAGGRPKGSKDSTKRKQKLPSSSKELYALAEQYKKLAEKAKSSEDAKRSSFFGGKIGGAAKIDEMEVNNHGVASDSDDDSGSSSSSNSSGGRGAGGGGGRSSGSSSSGSSSDSDSDSMGPKHSSQDVHANIASSLDELLSPTFKQ